MKAIKNITVGFAVSFIGSIPLGYLNIVGFQLYTQTDLMQLLYYLFGVVIVEAFVIYGTLQLVDQLNMNAKWKSRITFFSVFFLLFLAFYFYKNKVQNAQNEEEIVVLFRYPTLITGMLLSCFNFAQIPFWTTWNLFLLNGNYISNEKKCVGFYITGTVAGTFVGMLAFILGVNCIADYGLIAHKSVSAYMPLLLVGLAVFQIYQFISQNRKIRNN